MSKSEPDKIARLLVRCGMLYFLGFLLLAVFKTRSYGFAPMIPHCLLATGGVAICAAALTWKPKTRGRFALLLVSSGLAVYLLEFALGIMSSPQQHAAQKRIEAARAQGIPFDTRSKLQVIEDYRAEGKMLYPAICPERWSRANGLQTEEGRIFPVGSISRVLTMLDNENGFYPVYTSDRYGFNNPDGVWSSGPVDLVLTGDSFAMGCNVKPGQGIAGQLRRLGKTAITLGCAGNGPLTELATIKEYAERVRPKAVAWLYYENNDLWDLYVRDRQSEILMSYLKPGFRQHLHRKQAAIDRMLIEYVEKRMAEEQEAVNRRSSRTRAMYAFLSLRNIRALRKKPKPPQTRREFDPTEDPLFKEVLQEAKRTVASWGGQLYFVYLPEYTHYTNPGADDSFRNRREVLSVVKDLGLPVIDLHPVFQSHPDVMSLFPFGMSGHYDEDGYALVAAQIADRFDADGLRR